MNDIFPTYVTHELARTSGNDREMGDVRRIHSFDDDVKVLIRIGDDRLGSF